MTANEGGRRRISLSGKLLFLVIAHTLLAAVAAGVATAILPAPGVAFGAAALAGVLAAFVSVRWLSRSAMRSIDALEDGVRSLRDGDFSLRLALTRRDELGDLLDLYNQMADALRGERQEIRQRELLLDTVLQSAPLAIVLVGPGGRVVLANRASRAMLRGGRRLEGERFDEVLAAAPHALAEALREESDVLFTTAGEGEGEDETYRVARRVFHLDARRHVLHLVERLTPELRRREVEVWKKVIRVMSHEMNNSLAPIRSLVNSARTILGSPEHEHRLGAIFDTVEDRATYLAEFLEGYAHFARLARPRRREVPWLEFLEEVSRALPFRLSGEPPGRPGFFDPAQLQQVLINLLKNAKEAGSPEEEIRVSVHETADGGAAIRVADRGRGMTGEELAHSLVPFYSSKPLGTGLGLPLCNEILEAHGGRLRLQDREGGGVVVTCLLPGRMG